MYPVRLNEYRNTWYTKKHPLFLPKLAFEKILIVTNPRNTEQQLLWAGRKWGDLDLILVFSLEGDEYFYDNGFITKTSEDHSEEDCDYLYAFKVVSTLSSHFLSMWKFSRT